MALARTMDNKIIAGVCGGIAAEYKIDPVLVRLGFILLIPLGVVIGTFLLYIILWVIMPEAPSN
ncbi:MAG: PspC domain-containing protein [Phycisphaerales bacterium]|nr:PspC domain-containing protein [Phycisphaerales bacterium]